MLARGFYDDGARNAPAAPIQFPELLDVYDPENCPRWATAGRDYAVGPDVFYSSDWKDPASVPAGNGIQVDIPNRVLTVQAASIPAPVSFTGYNFDDWKVVKNGTTNGHKLSIFHSRFFVGSRAQAPIVCTQNAGDVTCAYLDMDGDDNTDLGNAAMFTASHGRIVLEYIWFRNCTFDGVKFGKNRPYRMRFCLFSGVLGNDPQAHFDCAQMLSTPCDALLEHNTVYVSSGAYFNSFARIASVNTDPIVRPRVGRNVIIARDGGSLANAIQIRGSDSVGGEIYRPYTYENFIDWSAANNGFFPIAQQADTSTLTAPNVRGNRRLTDGSIILPNTNF